MFASFSIAGINKQIQLKRNFSLFFLFLSFSFFLRLNVHFDWVAGREPRSRFTGPLPMFRLSHRSAGVDVITLKMHTDACASVRSCRIEMMHSQRQSSFCYRTLSLIPLRVSTTHDFVLRRFFFFVASLFLLTTRINSPERCLFNVRLRSLGFRWILRRTRRVWHCGNACACRENMVCTSAISGHGHLRGAQQRPTFLFSGQTRS